MTMMSATVSSVVQYRVPFDGNDNAFFKGLFGPIQHDEISGVKYLNLGTKDNFVETETDTLVIRPCYEHLLPHIQNPMYHQNRFRCAVTGTPGIGKTLFGLYLLRHFLIERNETVVYWARRKIFLFSFDHEVKKKFGLTDILVPSNDKTITVYSGEWLRREPLLSWTQFTEYAEKFNFIFIHDPNANEHDVAEVKNDIPRLIFLLCHGHDLISHWKSKTISMVYIYMPIWTMEEVEQCKQFLKVQIHRGKRKRDDFTVSDLDDESILYLYRCFGGCIRGWANDTLWDEIKSKIANVVKNQGDDVLQKNTNGRGSVIHLEVKFNKSRPIMQLAEKGSSQEALVGDDDGNDDFEHDNNSKPNDFSEFRYILGAEKIVEEFQEKLIDRGEEYLRKCLYNWAGQDGFESVYGSLFELHCHRMLQGNNGELRLKMRIVYEDKSKNSEDVYDVKLPKVQLTCRYPSNEASILEEAQFEDDVKLGTYFWPISCNHPTYDSAFPVKGNDLGVEMLQADNVALLLQMTVSGATRLPRRPEHSVKQLIRGKFEKVFKKRIDGFKQNGKAYTAFMVPTECFMPFLFQFEETAEGKKADKQPEFQLVFEVPDVFTYKKRSPRSPTSQGEFGERTIIHSYDEEKSPSSNPLHYHFKLQDVPLKKKQGQPSK